ncbi:MAG: LD-carboxypeptidase [Bacteroidota bacterium]
MPSRRQFLQRTALGALAPGLMLHRSHTPPPLVKPPRLRPGDSVGVISPAGAVYDAATLGRVRERLHSVGLRTVFGPNALDRRGYLAGTDEARAADLHQMVTNPGIQAILGLRGGWGSARLLPLLDYDLIRAHPKVLLGYSDITSLLIACYARAGLVTVHGPTGVSTWNAFTTDYLRQLLFDATPVRFEPPNTPASPSAPPPMQARTLVPGRARGRLVGGNLTVLSALIGSPYLPDWTDHILFLEDIDESTYRIDRMMTHLRLAGVLERLRGLVFGACTDCAASEGSRRSLSLREVLLDHLEPLGVPSFQGAMIGHIRDKFSVPIGVEAELDAEACTVRLLEPAVV